MVCFKRDNLFIFWREHGGAREMEKYKETPHRAGSPRTGLVRGLGPRTLRSWPERNSMLNRLNHPGEPLFGIFIPPD